MRLYRPIVFLSLAMPALAQTLVSLGTTSNCGSLGAAQVCTLTALVTNISDRSVTWNFSPQVLGASPGLPTGPNSAGETRITYRAPAGIAARQVVTATVTTVDGAVASAFITLIPTLEIGAGAPTAAVQSAFVSAFNRDGFNAKVTLPPVGPVRAIGSGGYVQEFADATQPSLRWALITASVTLGAAAGYATNVLQFPPDLYDYYTSVGANTAGYPLMDAQLCPGFDLANLCQYALFDKGYALFVYGTPLAEGQNFSIGAAFYTKWTALGGILGPGRPVSGESAVTARAIPPATTGTTATAQTFAAGTIYSTTSGANNGKIFGVIQPVYDLYAADSGPLGTLGLPIGDAIQVSTGVYRQTFEGGAVQYNSGGAPVLQFPVTAVRIAGAPAGAVSLNLGQTLSLSASPIDSTGTALTDRPVSWTTTNSRVVTVQASGLTAVVTAVGGGSASVTAVSQGVASPRVNITVIAPCCQIGDGAPATVQQLFQDALARNRITPQMPVPAPAARIGNGYVQMVQSADPAGTYMLAMPDQSGTAYVVSGALLARYQALGGPSGALGYPASDASPGGTQLFVSGAALAGNPVRIVSGLILSKWTAAGRESGAAGPPLSDTEAFVTFGGNSGLAQSFAHAAIYAATAGPLAGQAIVCAGPILARYQALGGPSGDFGMPTSDEFASGLFRRQNFEGGYIRGLGAEFVEVRSPKVPGIVAAPTSVPAGGRVRLALFGFPNDSTIRVSVTGKPDFLVTTANGGHSWDMFVPLAAPSATVSIRAADTGSSAAASGTLTVRGLSDNRIRISKIQGDNQAGMPGAMLPLGLRIALLDASSNPVAGAPIVFQASPGARLSSNAAVTGGSGIAEVFVRLPPAEGVAAVTADSPSVAQDPVTFFVRAAAGALANFPKFTQAAGSGHSALLAATASILRYRQNRGELPAPNGTVEPAALHEFLRSFCSADLKGSRVCDGYLANGASGAQIANLWRAADFTRGVDIAIHSLTIAAAADLLAGGSPALLSLALTRNGVPAGGHFVVATGIAADGALRIHDPNAVFDRASLADYLAGFNAAGATWRAELRGVVEFALRSPSATRFLVAALSQPTALMQNFTLTVQSAAGPCGAGFELLDPVDASGGPPAAGALVSRIHVCDGSEAAYQVTAGAAQPFRAFVTDLASAGSTVDISGNGVSTYKAVRPQLNLTLAPQEVSFAAEAVVNAATFAAGIAPGGMISIFGSGLWGVAAPTTVEIDGVAAAILSATPFQINAVVPDAVAPGARTIRVRSAYGAAAQPVAVSAVAPAIFLVGSPPAGALVNSDYSLNTPANPISRGQILIVYATGLGTVNRQGEFSTAAEPVTAVLNGQEISPVFAGIAPGYPGLYQVNVVVPVSMAPGLTGSFALKQAGVWSNTVAVAIQ